jgi:hypothetical protein
MILVCALCWTQQQLGQRGREACSSGKVIACRPSSTGMIPWSNMDWITASSMRASSGARLPVLVPREPMQQARATRVQLALEGTPYQKPKHTVGTDIIGIESSAFHHRHRPSHRAGSAGTVGGGACS